MISKENGERNWDGLFRTPYICMFFWIVLFCIDIVNIQDLLSVGLAAATNEVRHVMIELCMVSNDGYSLQHENYKR